MKNEKWKMKNRLTLEDYVVSRTRPGMRPIPAPRICALASFDRSRGRSRLAPANHQRLRDGGRGPDRILHDGRRSRERTLVHQLIPRCGLMLVHRRTGTERWMPDAGWPSLRVAYQR